MKLTTLAIMAAAALALAACSDDSSETPDQAVTQKDAAVDAAAPDQKAAPDHKAATPDKKAATPDKKVTTPDMKVTTPDQKAAPDQKLALPDAAMSCSAMVNAFATAKMEAKRCDRGKTQCSIKVIGSIYPMCPCPTFVNATKKAAVATMAALRAQFLAAKCTGPACKCANPQSAVCQIAPGGVKPMCEDKLTP